MTSSRPKTNFIVHAEHRSSDSQASVCNIHGLLNVLCDGEYINNRMEKVNE